MTFNRSAAESFLDETSDVKRSKMEAFLDEEDIKQPEEFTGIKETDIDPQAWIERKAAQEPATTPEVKKQLEQYAEDQKTKTPIDYGVEFASTFNTQFADLLGLPGDVYNFATGKLGIDSRTYGSDDFRRMGAKVGITNIENPDTPAAKAGEFTALGLQFLTPFIAFTGKTVRPGIAAVAPTSVTRGVVQQIGKPFQLTPKTALALEAAGSTGSGVGAYYGSEYGPTGELIGGIAGGLPTFSTPYLYGKARDFFNKSLFPYSARGGAIKASGVLKAQAETTQVTENIERATGKVLPESGLSPAKLSGDKHLLSLEKEILKDNPSLQHDFALQEARTNELAREELERLGSDIPIEQTQAYLRGRVERLTALIDVKVEKALTDSAEQLSKITTEEMTRKSANVIVRNKLKASLDSAREAERNVWSGVDDRILIPLNGVREYHAKYLSELAKTADPSEMPYYVRKFLGKMTKKGYKKGSLKDAETVKDVHAFYSRLGNDLAEEKAKDAPNWNKVRVIGELRKTMLDEMDVGDNSINAAIQFSRELNERFSGGALDIIFGSKKTGARVPAELTLESSIGIGPKGAASIKKVLEASPESAKEIESYVKSVIANSSFINTKGQVNIGAAEKFMRTSEEILNIFPELKSQLRNSIDMAKKATVIASNSEIRKGQLTASTANEIAKLKPGTVVGHVLKMPNPEAEMAKIYKQSDAQGKKALKGSIVEFLITKSQTQQADEANRYFISGQKLLENWRQNKAIFGKVFNSEENKRIETIINTLKMNEPAKGLPSVEGALAPMPNKVISMVVRTVATRAGAKLGAGTSGASLRTAAIASKEMENLLNKMDVGMSNKLLTEAIQNEELFKALMANTDSAPAFNKAQRVIQGWMIANILQEDNE